MITSFLKSLLLFVLVFFGLEYIAYDKSKIYLIVFMLVIISSVISLSFLGKQKIQSDKIAFALFPILFLGSLVGFFVFIPGETLRHAFAVVGSLLYAILIFYIGNLSEKEIFINKGNKNYSLGEISILVYAFLSYGCIYGFYLFLNLQPWMLMMQILIVSVFVVYFYFSYNKIKLSQNFVFYSVFGLVACEVAWALTFWPTGFISRALVLFILFYVFAGLMKHYFYKSLNRKILSEHLIVAVLFLAIILGTTRWTF